jgi:SnoaL-like polyketide cyclase
MARGGSPKAGQENIALADDVVSENAQINGVIADVTGPKRRLQERPAGFPDLSIHIVDMFSAGDKIVTRLVWRGTRASPYGMPGGRPAASGPYFEGWRFVGGKVAEIPTIQDQSAALKPDRKPSWRGRRGAAGPAAGFAGGT